VAGKGNPPQYFYWGGTELEGHISLSLEQAHKLCQAYTEKHKVRLFSQCWGCLKYSRDNPEKMCFYDPPDNNGCRFVNELYKSQNRT
jgi:hypothetical protein